MDKNTIIADIDKQINELGTNKTLWGLNMDNIFGVLSLDNIDRKITIKKRWYYVFLVLSILCFVLINIAFWKDNSKTGALLGFTIMISFTQMAIQKRDWERLKMIKYLLGLKATLEKDFSAHQKNK